MSEPEKAYTNGEITVLWKPGICLHSGKGVKGLGEVLNVSAHPWINMSGTNSERTIGQVEPCPSGARRYVCNKKLARAAG